MESFPDVPVRRRVRYPRQLRERPRRRHLHRAGRDERHSAVAFVLFCAAPSEVLLAAVAVAIPVQGELATRQQILVAAHSLQGRLSERAWPCDRYAPALVSALPGGERHALPGAVRCSFLAPDNLQIVPG